MPTIVALRQGTLEMFPDLRHRLLASSYHPRFTLREKAQGASRPVRPGADGTFSLSPAQFCELLQACPVAHGRLQAIVFPKVTGESGTIHLGRLSGEVAASRLAESLFKTGPSQVTSRVFDQSGDDFQTDQIMLDRLCRRLTSKVRCFECCLGEEAYESKASATAFIRHVMGDLDIGREMYGSPGIAQGE
jgi:hypothetical protein